MVETVTKRDGRKVSFDKEKIKQAVLSAFIEAEGEITSYARDKAAEIARYVESLSDEQLAEMEQRLAYKEEMMNVQAPKVLQKTLNG